MKKSKYTLQSAIVTLMLVPAFLFTVLNLQSCIEPDPPPTVEDILSSHQWVPELITKDGVDVTHQFRDFRLSFSRPDNGQSFVVTYNPIPGLWPRFGSYEVDDPTENLFSDNAFQLTLKSSDGDERIMTGELPSRTKLKLTFQWSGGIDVRSGRTSSISGEYVFNMKESP